MKPLTNEFLNESRKKGITININGDETTFGSQEHINDLKSTLCGMERLRDCYEIGSGNRLVFSQACNRLKKLIAQFNEN